MSQIRIKQVRSLIGVPHPLRRIVRRGLGLRGLHHEKLHKDNNCTRGMVNKVKHLVKYELVN